MFKLLFLFFPVFCFSQFSSFRNIHIIDFETNLPINNCQFYTKLGKINPLENGVFKINTDYRDSVILISNGYEAQYLEYNQIKDTIFLHSNSFELEAIQIIEKKKSKYYYLGSRRKRWDVQNSFGFDFYKNQKFATIFPNTSGEKRKIIEGYIYIVKKDTAPDLVINIYQNLNGKFGELLSSDITVQDEPKNEGWYRLNINNNIKFPLEGIIISILNMNGKSNSIYIGMNYYKKKMNIHSYTIINGEWIPAPLGFEEEGKPCGVKFYFKVK